MHILAVSITLYCVFQNAIGPDVQHNNQGKASRKVQDAVMKQHPPRGSGKKAAAAEAALMEAGRPSSHTGPRRELGLVAHGFSCKTFEWNVPDYTTCCDCSNGNLLSYKKFKMCLYNKGVVPGASNRALPTSLTFALPLLITLFSLYNSVSPSASNYDPHQVSPVPSCTVNQQDPLPGAFEDLADDGESVPLERVEEALLKLGFSKADVKTLTSNQKDLLDFDSFHMVMSKAILDKRIQEKLATDFISDKDKNKVSTEKLISFLGKVSNEQQRGEIEQLVIGNDKDGDGDLDKGEMVMARMMLGLKLDGIDPCGSGQQ